MSERIEIPEKRSTKRWLFVTMFMFTIGSLWIAQRDHEIMGWVGAVMFGYMTFALFKRMMDPRARVILTDQGIEDRNNGFGLIAWKDIDVAYINKIERQEFIAIKVYNDEEYLSRLSGLRRRTTTLNKLLGYSAITIPLTGLNIKADELLEMIEARTDSQGQYYPHNVS